MNKENRLHFAHFTKIFKKSGLVIGEKINCLNNIH